MCPVNFHVCLVNVFWPLVVTLGVVGVYSPYIVWISMNLNCYKYFILILLNGICDMDWVKKLVMVAIWCVQVVPLLRPSMREVTHMLEGILENLHPHVLFSTVQHPKLKSHPWYFQIILWRNEPPNVGRFISSTSLRAVSM